MKVEGHDHFTGKYQGSAHQECNLNFSICKKSLLCFMICKTIIHILSFKKLENIVSKQISYQKAITKYMSFIIKQPKRKDIKPGIPLVFIDSLRFINNSLANLVKNLGENEIYHLSQELDTNVSNLLKKKIFSLWLLG